MDTVSSVQPSQQAKATMEALEKVRKDLSVHCDAVFQAIEHSNRNSASQAVDGNTAPSLEQHIQPLSSPQSPSESTIWNPESSTNRGKYRFSYFKKFYSFVCILKRRYDLKRIGMIFLLQRPTLIFAR